MKKKEKNILVHIECQGFSRIKKFGFFIADEDMVDLDSHIKKIMLCNKWVDNASINNITVKKKSEEIHDIKGGLKQHLNIVVKMVADTFEGFFDELKEHKKEVLFRSWFDESGLELKYYEKWDKRDCPLEKEFLEKTGKYKTEKLLEYAQKNLQLKVNPEKFRDSKLLVAVTASTGGFSSMSLSIDLMIELKKIDFFNGVSFVSGSSGGSFAAIATSLCPAGNLPQLKEKIKKELTKNSAMMIANKVINLVKDPFKFNEEFEKMFSRTIGLKDGLTMENLMQRPLNEASIFPEVCVSRIKEVGEYKTDEGGTKSDKFGLIVSNPDGLFFDFNVKYKPEKVLVSKVLCASANAPSTPINQYPFDFVPDNLCLCPSPEIPNFLADPKNKDIVSEIRIHHDEANYKLPHGETLKLTDGISSDRLALIPALKRGVGIMVVTDIVKSKYRSFYADVYANYQSTHRDELKTFLPESFLDKTNNTSLYYDEKNKNACVIVYINPCADDPDFEPLSSFKIHYEPDEFDKMDKRYQKLMEKVPELIKRALKKRLEIDMLFEKY